jgi:hypothetical protein
MLIHPCFACLGCVDQYRSTDYIAQGPGKLEMVYTPKDGGEKVVMNVYDFKGPGVARTFLSFTSSALDSF